MKKIAVINDLSGLGKCSLTAAIPVISVMGVQACPLPTAVLSNQTGYESYFCEDFTEHMEPYMEQWKKDVYKRQIHDRELPEDLDGLLLSGGYPELNGEALEENQEMCTRIREVILDGMPCLAECGGFMYLHQEMEDMEGKQRRVCGVIPGRAYRTPKLNRFGYITLTEKQDTGCLLYTSRCV